MKAWFRRIDWILLAAIVPVVGVALISMSSFVRSNYYAPRQVLWALIAFGVFILASNIDWRFLRRTSVIVLLYVGITLLLVALFAFGHIVKGAESWFSFGLFHLQPSDIAKLVTIIILAKYFSRRHIEIAHYRHIIVSATYMLIPFALVLVQPDFGSAIMIGCVWLGMILVSGVSKKHLAILLLLGAGIFTALWLFVFAPYQKARIITFIHPKADIHGAGYNAFQSTVAVGSGQILGKGVGYGTQSRLEFLPEYQTDFIFAAFSEEWGFVGVLILFVLFGIIYWRMFFYTFRGATNFEILFGAGVITLFFSHMLVNIGMNIGLLPVTGITLPLMSYGGSHLVIEMLALGMMVGMHHYSYGVHKEDTAREFLGI